MATDVDKAAILKSYDTALGLLDRTAAMGRELARKIDRLYLVGCGGPNRAMLTVEYWVEHYSPGIEVRRFFPAEFMMLNPRRLDGRTLVVLGSKSGTTPETVQAAEFVRAQPCHVIAITEKSEFSACACGGDALVDGRISRRRVDVHAAPGTRGGSPRGEGRLEPV